MYQALKVAQDPNAMMQNMITSNPKLSQLMGIVNMFGGDPKTAFFNEAKRKGVDPNTILNMFR